MIGSARLINSGIDKSALFQNRAAPDISPCHFLSFLDVLCESQTFQGHAEGRGVTCQSRSPDRAVHHEVDCGASWELPDGALLHRRVDFDLPHVCVSAILVVGQHRDLDHEGADRLVCPLKHKHALFKSPATLVNDCLPQNTIQFRHS